MAVVTKEDVSRAVASLGIQKGDMVLFHSSLKSVGYVEGGADAVIDGFLDVIGGDGTLVCPTLCQRDWENVYRNWHPDAPSDVGYITNVFRKRKNAFRSNQATHSVAAIGKNAEYLTKTHGESGKRPGIFGDTPFSADSPWEKMYRCGAKIVFVGVSMLYCTFRHYAEYVYMENGLKQMRSQPGCEQLERRLWTYGKNGGVWPHIANEPVGELLKHRGEVREAICGDAKFLCVDAITFVDCCTGILEEVNEAYLNKISDYDHTVQWMKQIKELRERERKNVY